MRLPWRTGGLVALAAMSLLLALGILTGSAGEDEPIRLPPPPSIDDELASRLTAAALAAPGAQAGLAPGSRRTISDPTPIWEPEGPCAGERPGCALIAIYDYGTRRGTHMLLTLADEPQVVSVETGADVPVGLTPAEGVFGYEIAERSPEVQALLANGYRRKPHMHGFAPLSSGDPCAVYRCVIVDYVPVVEGAGKLEVVIVDLDNERIVQRSW